MGPCNFSGELTDWEVDWRVRWGACRRWANSLEWVGGQLEISGEGACGVGLRSLVSEFRGLC